LETAASQQHQQQGWQCLLLLLLLLLSKLMQLLLGAPGAWQESGQQLMAVQLQQLELTTATLRARQCRACRSRWWFAAVMARWMCCAYARGLTQNHQAITSALVVALLLTLPTAEVPMMVMIIGVMYDRQ
jgi:hypothetical protein